MKRPFFHDGSLKGMIGLLLEILRDFMRRAWK
jgi:hypothetical protein